MNVLLIDVGNTRLKWAIYSDSAELQPGSACQYSRDTLMAQLGVLLADLPPVDRVLLASVAPAQVGRDIRRYANERWGVQVEEIATPVSGGGLRNAYIHPERLGVDRWLAMRGACLTRPVNAPLWVVDCGTAITIDYVDVSGQHQGGVILPGLAMMARQMSQQAYQLDFGIEPSFAKQGDEVGILAKDTETAMRVGIMTSLVAALDRIVASQPRASEQVLTGGDGERFKQLLTGHWSYRPDLVLEGMAAMIEELS